MFDGLLRFQISEKSANLQFPLNIQKQKVFQLKGHQAVLNYCRLTCQTTESNFHDFYARTLSHAVSEPFTCDILACDDRAASSDDVLH